MTIKVRWLGILVGCVSFGPVWAGSAAEDVIWISTHPYKYAGNDIVIKATPTAITLNYPGI